MALLPLVTTGETDAERMKVQMTAKVKEIHAALKVEYGIDFASHDLPVVEGGRPHGGKRKQGS